MAPNKPVENDPGCGVLCCVLCGPCCCCACCCCWALEVNLACFGIGGCKYSCLANDNTSIRSSFLYAKQLRIKLWKIEAKKTFPISLNKFKQSKKTKQKIPLLRLLRRVYWQIELLSLLILYFLLKLLLAIDCAQMVSCHINIDKILHLHSTRPLLMIFLEGFYRQRNILEEDT